MTAVGTRAETLEQLGHSFKTAMAAVRRLRGRETHRPGELSYAQYALLFGLSGCAGATTEGDDTFHGARLQRGQGLLHRGDER